MLPPRWLGGLPVVMKELDKHGMIHTDCLTGEQSAAACRRSGSLGCKLFTPMPRCVAGGCRRTRWPSWRPWRHRSWRHRQHRRRYIDLFVGEEFIVTVVAWRAECRTGKLEILRVGVGQRHYPALRVHVEGAGAGQTGAAAADQRDPVWGRCSHSGLVPSVVDRGNYAIALRATNHSEASP